MISFQISNHETEIENLKRENESIKVTFNDRDERAKQILKNARAKILLLTEDKKKLEEILSKGEYMCGIVIPPFFVSAISTETLLWMC